MTAILVTIVCGATVFLEQEIPGLRYVAGDALTGTIQPNYRQLDLDADGYTDLLFPDRVLFQRDGTFPAGSMAMLPPMPNGTACDSSGDALYLRYPGGLRLLVWRNEGWDIAHEQPVNWPDMPAPAPDEGEEAPPQTTSSVTFARFLIDIDEDAVPEIVVYARSGVYIYRRHSNDYELEGIVELYPQVAATAATSGPVWPPERRRLSAPGQRLDLTAVWRGSRLTIVSRQELRSGEVQYRSRSASLGSGDRTIHEYDYPLMHASMRPLFLNGDDRLDFAGGTSVSTTSTAFSEPIFDTFVSTNQSATVQRFRTKSFPPGSTLVDIDGDGNLDLVTHTTKVTAGGLRESLNRYFFQRTVGHLVSFHLQDASGHFVHAPGLTVDLSIQLEKVPYQEGSMFRRYRSGDLIDVTGDFNGDGRNDLVVQESSDSLAIFLSRGYRYSKHPIYYLSIHKNERFYVTDVDGNGLSDVVLIRPGNDRTGDRSRVYFTRQTAP